MWAERVRVNDLRRVGIGVLPVGQQRCAKIRLEVLQRVQTPVRCRPSLHGARRPSVAGWLPHRGLAAKKAAEAMLMLFFLGGARMWARGVR